MSEAAARAAELAEKKLAPPIAVADARPRLAPIPFNQILLGTSAVYLVKDLIPREGLVVIWGPPKCGKSFWTFDLTMHVALGWEYRGRKVKGGAVVYVACEGQQGFRARIEAFRQRHLSEETADIPFYLVPAALDLIAEREDLIAAIRAELGDIKPAAVVFDTLNRSIQGDENSPQDMTDYIRAAGAVQEAFGCVAKVVHHCGVEGKRPRGHTSLTGAADAQIAVKRDKAAGTITATVEWMKDGLEGAEICSHLEAMEVGVDEDGEPITSCVIVPAEKRNVAVKTKLTDRQRNAIQALCNHFAEPEFPALTFPKFDSLMVSKGVYDEDTKRQRFSDLRNQLSSKNLIVIHDQKIRLPKPKWASGNTADTTADTLI